MIRINRGCSLSAGLAAGLDTATSSNASETEPGKPKQEEQEIDIVIGETDMGILIPESRMSEAEKSFLSCIPDKGMRKDYELIEYMNDVNREYTEVLMETNIDGRVSKAYTYGNERISIENSTGWKGYYLYDPRKSVSSVTNRFAAVSIAYRYTPTGEMTLGKPQYRNVYGYNGESYNPNTGLQYLRARYFQVEQGNFLTENTYLGNLAEPLTLNQYNYTMGNPVNYIDKDGHEAYIYERDGYYYIEPDNKWYNISSNIMGLIPFADSAAKGLDEAISIYRWEYIEEDSNIFTAISSGTTIVDLRGTIENKAGLTATNMRNAKITKIIGKVGTVFTIITFGSTMIDSGPKVSRATVDLYRRSLSAIPDKDILEQRYRLLYNLVGTAMGKGAITYCIEKWYDEDAFLIVPDSTKISDMDKFHEAIEEVGCSPADVLKWFPRE